MYIGHLLGVFLDIVTQKVNLEIYNMYSIT